MISAAAAQNVFFFYFTLAAGILFLRSVPGQGHISAPF
jgi:hypothetical protein